MARALATLLALSAVAPAIGCVGGHRGGVDSGGPMVDLGPAHDGGPGLDGGPGHDSGPGHDGGPGVDSGPGSDGGCGALIPYFDMTSCDPATFTCITGCAAGDTTCVDGCYAADSNPMMGCLLCVEQNQLACANSLGCMTSWTPYDCCVSAHCPAGSPMGCDMTNCPSETTAFNNCVNGVFGGTTPPACTSHARMCFGMM